jgi:hypothetical protein
MSIVRMIVDDVVSQAVLEGVREGFEQAAFDRCDGAYDCEDRCPMPIGQCVCAWVHYRKLPWWKKTFSSAPPRPSQDQVIECLIRNAVGVTE